MSMNKAQLAQMELARRELARRHLRHFVSYTFPGYIRRPHNQLVADTIDLAVYGIIKRLMIFMPAQYGKSELVSRKTPPFVLGKFPNKRIILCSYNAELAYSFSREARDLISSQAYQNIFGKGALEEERGVELSEQAKSVKAWNLKGMRGGLVAAGVGGGITGFSADFAIIDDPIKDDDEALSEKVRQRHWDWYWSALYTRLSPNSPIIFTMTRWHEDDLAGRLLKAQERNNEYWHVLRMPAVAEHPNQIKKWAEENYVHPSRLLNRRTVTQMLEEAIADGRIR